MTMVLEPALDDDVRSFSACLAHDHIANLRHITLIQILLVNRYIS